MDTLRGSSYRKTTINGEWCDRIRFNHFRICANWCNWRTTQSAAMPLVAEIIVNDISSIILASDGNTNYRGKPTLDTTEQDVPIYLNILSQHFQ